MCYGWICIASRQLDSFEDENDLVSDLIVSSSVRVSGGDLGVSDNITNRQCSWCYVTTFQNQNDNQDLGEGHLWQKHQQSGAARLGNAHHAGFYVCLNFLNFVVLKKTS